MNKLVSIGKILNFHGIKGEVKMGFTSGNEAVIKNLKHVFIFENDQKQQYDVVSVRFHKNFAIIKFKQINSIDDVMKVKGLLVHTTEEVLKNKLQKDEFLVSDLTGLEVFDKDGNKIGKVFDVGENKASNIIEIQKLNGLRFMIPFVKEWVPFVDIENNKLIVNLLDGIDSLSSVKSEE